MTKEQERKLEAVAAALEAYHDSGARDLPSVRKSVPRSFLNPVDTLVAALDEALG